ncbi:hypothetical protein [Kribbella italica]|uniref:Arsenate reductase n=1 Tax=Kribbella italica TaxID=1540520 RepID=A0A7W9JE87_9ACTN|nr:hypothetical protein [Kribbella italica]MBB5840531.1 hypothetical protein [Kribbella italica]
MCTSDTSPSSTGLDWVPASCTLPTVEQPIRVAEFDDLFSSSVRGAERIDATTLRLDVAADAEARARDLASRESTCCSFFGFDFAPVGDVVEMTVTVPAAHVAVLDAFATRATAAVGHGARAAG